MTWLKICGTTNRDDALAAVTAGADAVGFVFAPSPRHMEPDAARDIVAALPPTVEKVGVFSNQPAERVRDIARQVGLTAIQLHGDETPDYVRKLVREPSANALERGRMRIFKTVFVTPGVEGALREFAACEEIDGLLLDAAVLRAAGMGRGAELVRGGTGVTFDWKRAAEFVPGIAQRTRVIVAGGLSPANVAEAVRVLRPWGVDVCTGVETAVGRKDKDKIQAFVAAVRNA